MRALGILLFIFWSSLGWSQARLDGIVINADNMSRDARRQVVELEGHVQLAFKGQYLSCHKATIYMGKKIIKAQGNVVIRSATAYAEGSSLELDYNKNTGTFYDSFVQAGQVVFEGKVIQKVGENEYIADDAHFTACTNCPTSWGFSGKRIEAEIGGYAYIKYPLLRIHGVPVLFLPAIMLPLKSARQSGVLVPSFDFKEKTGASIEESYFWAISRSQDMTLGARYYQLSGLKGLGEYRFMLSDQSKGSLQSAYMYDKTFEDFEENSYPMSRWFYNYNHYFVLPNDVISRVSYKDISDLYYPKDFPKELLGRNDTALENRISLTKNTESMHMSIEAGIYKNLMKTDSLSDNEDAVHRVPEIRWSIMEQRVLDTDLLFRADVNYVNFARNGFGYDDVACTGIGDDRECAVKQNADKTKQTHDGDFDDKIDITRTGQRFDVQPMLTYPIKIGKTVELVPSVLYRETQYQFADEFANSAARRYIQTNVSLSTKLQRIFGDLQDDKARRWKHEIEPGVAYSNIPWMRQPDNEFFGDFGEQPYSRTFEPITDADFDNLSNRIQFDYNDRVFNKNLVDMSFTNRLTRKRFVNGEPEYRNVVLWRISQSYDYREAGTDIPQPWSPIRNLLILRFDNFETNTRAEFNPYARVPNINSRLKFKNEKGDHYLLLKYSHQFTISNNNQVEPDSERQAFGGGIGYTSRYLDLVAEIEYSNTTHQLQSWGYAAVFRPPGDCWGIRFGHQQLIGDDASFNFGFNFNFGGEKLGDKAENKQI